MKEYIIEYTINGKIRLETESTNPEDIESEALAKINSGELGEVTYASVDNLENIEEHLGNED